MLFARVVENLLGIVELDEVTGPSSPGRVDIQECGAISDALGLLQVVRDNGDGEAFLEFLHQFLDFARRNRIERRAGFVHQEHFGLRGNGASDAQTLLLSARERQTAAVQFVLDLIP